MQILPRKRGRKQAAIEHWLQKIICCNQLSQRRTTTPLLRSVLQLQHSISSIAAHQQLIQKKNPPTHKLVQKDLIISEICSINIQRIIVQIEKKEQTKWNPVTTDAKENFIAVVLHEN